MSDDAMDWDQQARADDDQINNLLSGMMQNGDDRLNIAGGNIEDIDQSGKADDAMDFGDISDDDLPDEEDATTAKPTTNGITDATATTDNDDGMDLFGEGIKDDDAFDDLFGSPSPPTAQNDLPALTDDGGTSNHTEHVEDDLFGEHRSEGSLFGGDPPTPEVDQATTINTNIVPESSFRNPPAGADVAVNDGDDYDMSTMVATNQDPNIPPAIESVEELLKQKWPSFKPGIVLEWNKLLPPKPSEVTLKAPTKKMKPLITSKLTLEIAPDQERMFRLPGVARRKYENAMSNFIQLGMDKVEDEIATENEISIDNEGDEDEPIGGFTLQDIATVCFDFSVDIEKAEKTTMPEEPVVKAIKTEPNADADGNDEDDWDRMFMEVEPEVPVVKKKREINTGLPEIPRYTAPSFDDFESQTKRLGKRVYVDFADPNLHLEKVSPETMAKRQKLEAAQKQKANNNLGKFTRNRFNIANDEAYELLKENHKHKVRATLGNINVEHSLPALKLAWPYYRVKLDVTPDRFHRPPLRLRQIANTEAEFFKHGHVKRKYTKGKVHDVFKETKDLSLNDNATAVLFEYCERIPTVLSKFGMANRVINYYRKMDANDEQMPEKLDIGETHVLLPEDRSPFSIFGTVDPGEMVPTFHNQMYRAPLFKHKVRTGDFLLGRNSTGLGGSRWYLRNIDHIYVVGQTFPSVEVPGPHSRKVTNASKNRIKMISYRLMRKDPQNLVNLSDITKHIADSTDAQNRQKLKEFLSYAKGEKGQWKLREGEVLMEEERIRAMIKPEDTCLIDGMSLGLKMLEDAGFDPKNAVLDEESGDDDEDGPKSKGAKKNQDKAEEALADKMAPWKTSKAFIDACAGKAMLQLHGEGDPTGHGLGFSFIRTSMKGGYIEAVQGPMATSADAMERQKRENNGHAYNVKQQEAMYREGINKIWGKQRATLSDPTLHDDNDVLHTVDEDERFNSQQPNSAHPGQMPIAEDGFSQISGFTSASRAMNRKKLRIMRQVRQADGSFMEQEEIVEDPVVIAHYLKRRDEVDSNPANLYDLAPTGNADRDRQGIKKVEEELARLKKNRDRRKTREKQKALSGRPGEAGPPDPGTPASTVGEKSATGTTRKCANCGQVGHIKTNKKLCPLLNGTIKNDGAGDMGGFGGFSAAPTPQQLLSGLGLGGARSPGGA